MPFFAGMIFFYILPLVVIVVSYGGIIIHLHRKSYFEPAREVARICGSSPRENENQPRHLEWPQHHFNEDEGKRSGSDQPSGAKRSKA